MPAAPSRSLAALCGALAAALAGPSAAQDWPQWRGPARDGVVANAAPSAWPRELKPGWKVTVGTGHSSPVVVGERLFLHTREGESEVVSSFDLASGRGLWRQEYPAPYTMNPAAGRHGKGPKSTPVVHGGRVYTLGIGGILSCFDAATGRFAWRHDFAGRFRQTSPLFGAAMSPVVAEGLLVAHVGGHDDGALTAFDAATGAVRWAWKGDGPGYASPVVAELGGVRQVVTQTQSRLVGLSLAQGELLWSLPFTTDYDQNAVTPVVHGQTVIYSGLGKGVRAVRITRNVGGFAAEPAWDNSEVSLYLSSPVLADGLLFGVSHRQKGQVFCLDAATGKTLWLSPGRQAESAAVLAAGDVLLLLTTEAELIVARKDARAFAPLATYTVAESPTWAHPVLVGQALLVKDVETLAQWRLD